MKKTNVILSLALILPLALGAASCGRRAGKQVDKQEQTTGAAVAIETVATTDMPETYMTVGTVAPRGSSSLSSKIVGNILSVNVMEGDAVTAGQTLIVIDSSDIETQVRAAESGLIQARKALSEVEDGIGAAEAGVDSAKANADLARKTYDRYLDLKNNKSVSQQEFDQVEARMRVADANVAQARRQADAMKSKKSQAEAQISQAGDAVSRARIMRGYATIKAPYSGVVVKKTAEPGQLAAPGSPLITVEYSTGYRLEAAVDESRMGKIRLQGVAEVEIPSLGGKTLQGKIVEISRSADAASRSFIAKIALPNDPRLRSGMFGRATFTVGTVSKIMVPAAAISHKGALAGVFVIDPTGAARFRAVKTGEAGPGGMVEALAGLNPGDRIVTSGADRLTDGQKAKVK